MLAGQALGALLGAQAAGAQGAGRESAGRWRAARVGARQERQARGCTGGRGAGVGARRRARSAWQERGRRAAEAARAREACCWPTGCALGALSLFLAWFDSVLFLSQFLDIVREPGS